VQTLPEIIGQITTEQAAFFYTGYCRIIVYRNHAGQFVQTSGEGDAYPDIQDEQEELFNGIGSQVTVPCWRLIRLLEEDRVVA
jgi:hypothetical protein